MSDPVFTGMDVDGALAAAAEALGRERSSLRYVVLDGGTPGGRGLSPTSARVAVILEKPRPATGPVREEPERGSVPKRVREAIEHVLRAGDLSVEAEVELGEEALVVSLSGADCGFFSGSDGEGEALRSLEHLLLGMFGRSLPSGRLVLKCEGFRERREDAICRRAQALAEGVREDGVARETGPLNSYERRLVHMAVSALPGLVTYSVGDGADRRVTIARAGSTGLPAESAEPA